MNNCFIEGTYGNYLDICVKPGRERLVKITKEDGALDYDVQISKLYYKITKNY